MPSNVGRGAPAGKRWELARAYVAAGDYDKAVSAARDAIRRRPVYPHAHYVLAIALGHLGRLTEAGAALRECERLDPGFTKGRRDWKPYTDPARNEHLREGLRKAGVNLAN